MNCFSDKRRNTRLSLNRRYRAILTSALLILLVSLLIGPLTYAEENIGYLGRTWSQEADVVITLNGITVHERKHDQNPGGKAGDFSRYVLDGQNTLLIEFTPSQEETDEPSALINLEKWTQREGDYVGLFLNSHLIGGGTLHHGTYDDEEEIGEFELVNGTYMWEFEFGVSNFGKLPYELKCFVGDEVANMTLSFANAARTIVVQYTDLHFEEGSNRIDLLSTPPNSGEEFIDEDVFSIITLSYTEPAAPVTIVLDLSRQTLEPVENFPIRIPLVFEISDDTMDGANILFGSFDPLVGQLQPEEDEENEIWIWECVFDQGKEYDRIPSELRCLSNKDALLSIEFRNANDDVVRYENLTVEMGYEVIPLWQSIPEQGAQHLDGDGFNRLRIESDHDLSLIMAMSSSRKTAEIMIEFDAEMPHVWSWATGEDIAQLTQNDRDAISQVVSDLHTALSNLADPDNQIAQAAATAVGVIMWFRGRDEALMEGIDQQQLIDEEVAEIVNIATSANTWGMEPLNTNQLEFLILENGKIVKVTGPNDAAPLTTIQFSFVGEDLWGEPYQFQNVQIEMELYFSKIQVEGQGLQWRVVK